MLCVVSPNGFVCVTVKVERERERWGAGGWYLREKKALYLSLVYSQ